jgi:hypothetical protein
LIRAATLCLALLATARVGAAIQRPTPTPTPQDCDARIVAAVAALAGVDIGGPHADRLISAACKPFPSRPHTVIAAVGLRRTEDVVDVHLVLWNEVDGRIEARGVEAIEEDAALELHEDSLGIDTARYRLAPDVRAFGLYVGGTSQASCPDGGFGDERRLYVQEGAHLRRVLGPMDTTTWQILIPGRDMCHPQAPERDAILENYDSTVSIGAGSSHGFHDLIVTITPWRDDGKRPKLQPFVYTLRYDGREYPTQAMDAAYWAWRRQE